MNQVEMLGAGDDFSAKTALRMREQRETERREAWSWKPPAAGRKLRVQMAGLGDVGQNTAIGLTLLGGEQLESIGLFDLNQSQVRRMELELSQFAAPPGGREMPKVSALTEEDLFDCDLFLFCATKAVPKVGSAVGDVRMAQFEANRKIVSFYANMASDRNYRGLFLVISDPVDLLCMEALRGGRTLHPAQIRGCGLGVMYARARYYAGKNAVFASYLSGGRAFGPHGKDLVIANAVKEEEYDDLLSRELTALTVQANMEVRSLGYKPFLAPAMSSAVLTILAMIRGEWHYSAAYLNGLYFGALNRMTETGTKWEEDPLPPLLYQRLESAYRSLEEILWK